MDEDELYDVCYECTGYGDDYRYDEESQDLICNCDDCWVMQALMRGDE